MNEYNIKHYFKLHFEDDGITREYMYTTSFEDTDFYENPIICYNTTDDFINYMNDICENANFFRYCRYHRKLDNSNFEEIVKEIECNEKDYNEKDLYRKEYVYNWYFKNRVKFFLSKQFDFFLKIVDDLEKEKETENNKN